jgi:hypothetical protein
MSSWKTQDKQNGGSKDSSVSLPLPPAEQKQPSSLINPTVVANTTAAPSPPISIPSTTINNVSTNQPSFPHQQPPVLPPPSAIGNGMYILRTIYI